MTMTCLKFTPKKGLKLLTVNALIYEISGCLEQQELHIQRSLNKEVLLLFIGR